MSIQCQHGPGISAPTSPQRSGSATSLASWASLGAEGRNFVARGPSPAQLSEFPGRRAEQPIRIYVGLDTAKTAPDRARTAVQELVRTGALRRSVLIVAGTTGFGWLEPQSVDSIEYLWNGDTAIVATQYSFLPSWISFLFDKDRAADSGAFSTPIGRSGGSSRAVGRTPDRLSSARVRSSGLVESGLVDV